MFDYLGIDTSNYTTSIALFDSESKEVVHKRKLLPVKHGELGLRQSEAVFSHVRQVHILIEELIKEARQVSEVKLKAVGVSVSPRDVKGSYMPCFLVGESVARSIASVCGCECYKFSHQVGHIAAAAYSADMPNVLKKEHIALHFSGGTTECLLVSPCEEKIIRAQIISQSMDISVGQLIDRVGVMLGLPFPCGAHMEKLSNNQRTTKHKVAFKGLNPCLSGIENKAKTMLEKAYSHSEIIDFTMDCVLYCAQKMLSDARVLNKDCEIICAGGVMANRSMKAYLNSQFGAYFAEAEFSSDNAFGTAVLAALKHTQGVKV